MSKKHSESLSNDLDNIFAEEMALSRENHFALYGYLFAHYDLGRITLDEFTALYKRLDLTVDEIDELLL